MHVFTISKKRRRPSSTSINHFSFRQAVQGFSRFSLSVTPSFPKVGVLVVHKIQLYYYCSSCWQKCNDETLLPSSFSSFNFSLDDKTWNWMMYIKKEPPVISISLCLFGLPSHRKTKAKRKCSINYLEVHLTYAIWMWDQDLQTLISTGGVGANIDICFGSNYFSCQSNQYFRFVLSVIHNVCHFVQTKMFGNYF